MFELDSFRAVYQRYNSIGLAILDPRLLELGPFRAIYVR